MSTPSRLHQDGSSACSASMNAATPPFRWAWATACRAIVVLPLDSGPNSSMIRPRGNPLPPSARSSDRAPGRDPLDLHVRPLAQLHDRPGAERLLDLADRVVQGLLLGRHRRLAPRSFPVAWPRRSLLPASLSGLCTQEHYTSISAGAGQGEDPDFLPSSRARLSGS